MSENLAASQHTKHVDIRYKFVVNEFVEDGFLKIMIFFVIFVTSEDSKDADLLTKSLKGELLEKHSKKMIAEKGKSELVINRKGVGNVDVVLLTPMSRVDRIVYWTHRRGWISISSVTYYR